jgi:UDP-N-acetylmuramate--alanine ligase
MTITKQTFFCGIGGSGMLPLAMIMKARGHDVAGSDRSHDQGRSPEKFAWLEREGVKLTPQDGSGVTSSELTFITSGAVEETVPDVKAALEQGAMRMTRAEVLAALFNEAETSIGVAGTSGKSTTTGMIGWILSEAGKRPTIINGAVMKNFSSDDAPFASAVPGDDNIVVSEVDESDGSIAQYNPKIAVLNNISIDHKTMDELRTLFRAYVKSADMAVLNLDNEETKLISAKISNARKTTYSLNNPLADLYGSRVAHTPNGVSFDLVEIKSGIHTPVTLQMPGAHNVSNALAAISATSAVGVPVAEAARHIESFTGIRRRLELVGTRGGITVIDDFAHNPDKIAASLATLHQSEGRLLIFFQPHGFGPLAKMKDEFIQTFSQGLADEDILILSEPVYFGGTVERKVTAKDIVEGVKDNGRAAEIFETREECGARIKELKQHRDRIVIMGARDDTLSEFAIEMLG